MNPILVMPERHRVFLEHALLELQHDDRIVGVAAGGSFLTQRMDEFSDLDLVLAIEPSTLDDVMRERTVIASRLGQLVAAFTGEHVGEPRLLICLYDDPVLHVDLKFVTLLDVAVRVETPTILWERDTRFATALTTNEATFPVPDLLQCLIFSGSRIDFGCGYIMRQQKSVEVSCLKPSISWRFSVCLFSAPYRFWKRERDHRA